MRLAAAITVRTDKLIAAAKKGDTQAGAFSAHLTALRSDAYLAYLDGKVARAKTLNREADRLSRVVAAGRIVWLQLLDGYWGAMREDGSIDEIENT